MTPKLTELIDSAKPTLRERAATLTPQERLELLTYLQPTPDRPELWDLSPATIASRNAEMRKVLAEWRE